MLKLHYFPGSCAFVPHVALEWSGLPYQAQAETRESIKEPAYLKLNPLGQVPLLEDDGWTLTQNVAIVGYIHDLAPKAGIFGHGDTRTTAKARQWLSFANSDLHRQFSLVFGPARFVADEAAQQALAAANPAEITDEASAVERLGLQPLLVQGDSRNLKLTWPADERIARLLLQDEAT